MMRKPIIAGNWKMNKLTADGISLAQELKDKLPTTDNREVVICPPFTLLSLIAQVLKGSNVILGAQNVFAADSGAYTGEISPLMLKDLGIRYCIIGHSERRQYFKENDVIVNQKVKEALKSEIKPIICIGESLEEREKNLTFSRLKEQIAGALSGLVPLELAKGLSQNNVNHLPEVILERDKEQRVLRSKATQTMSDAVAAQKRPGPLGSPIFKALRRCSSAMCHRHKAFVAPCTDFKSGTPNSQPYFETAPNIVIAYEPLWAIGTGKTATPEQAEEVHSFIRKEIASLYGKEIASSLRIQYGGSVKPENIASLMKKENIDGALVGGASLSADSFIKIVNY